MSETQMAVARGGGSSRKSAARHDPVLPRACANTVLKDKQANKSVSKAYTRVLWVKCKREKWLSPAAPAHPAYRLPTSRCYILDQYFSRSESCEQGKKCTSSKTGRMDDTSFLISCRFISRAWHRDQFIRGYFSSPLSPGAEPLVFLVRVMHEATDRSTRMPNADRSEV